MAVINVLIASMRCFLRALCASLLCFKLRSASLLISFCSLMELKDCLGSSSQWCEMCPAGNEHHAPHVGALLVCR